MFLVFYLSFGGSIEGGQFTPSNIKPRLPQSHKTKALLRNDNKNTMTTFLHGSLRGGRSPTKQSCRYCFCGFWGKVRKGVFVPVIKMSLRGGNEFLPTWQSHILRRCDNPPQYSTRNIKREIATAVSRPRDDRINTMTK